MEIPIKLRAYEQDAVPTITDATIDALDGVDDEKRAELQQMREQFGGEYATLELEQWQKLLLSWDRVRGIDVPANRIDYLRSKLIRRIQRIAE